MRDSLRRAWTEIVTAEDLDQHLLEAGQAKTNARLVCRALTESPLPTNARLLAAGAGTGQILDYADVALLSRFILTFTDINEEFLVQIERRIAKHASLHAVVEWDDIEKTQLKPSFEGIIAVLLLEHIDWRLGVAAMIKLKPQRIYLIVQRNELGGELLSRNRQLAPSIEEFSKNASPNLVKVEELKEIFSPAGYDLLKDYYEPVLDGKTMVGLVFGRHSTPLNGSDSLMR